MAPSFGNDIDPPAGNPDAKAPSLEAREKNKKLQQGFPVVPESFQQGEKDYGVPNRQYISMVSLHERIQFR